MASLEGEEGSRQVVVGDGCGVGPVDVDGYDERGEYVAIRK